MRWLERALLVFGTWAGSSRGSVVGANEVLGSSVLVGASRRREEDCAVELRHDIARLALRLGQGSSIGHTELYYHTLNKLQTLDKTVKSLPSLHALATLERICAHVDEDEMEDTGHLAASLFVNYVHKLLEDPEGHVADADKAMGPEMASDMLLSSPLLWADAFSAIFPSLSICDVFYATEDTCEIELASIETHKGNHLSSVTQRNYFYHDCNPVESPVYRTWGRRQQLFAKKYAGKLRTSSGCQSLITNANQAYYPTPPPMYRTPPPPPPPYGPPIIIKEVTQPIIHEIIQPVAVQQPPTVIAPVVKTKRAGKPRTAAAESDTDIVIEGVPTGAIDEETDADGNTVYRVNVPQQQSGPTQQRISDLSIEQLTAALMAALGSSFPMDARPTPPPAPPPPNVMVLPPMDPSMFSSFNLTPKVSPDGSWTVEQVEMQRASPQNAEPNNNRNNKRDRSDRPERTEKRNRNRSQSGPELSQQPQTIQHDMHVHLKPDPTPPAPSATPTQPPEPPTASPPVPPPSTPSPPPMLPRPAPPSPITYQQNPAFPTAATPLQLATPIQPLAPMAPRSPLTLSSPQLQQPTPQLMPSPPRAAYTPQTLQQNVDFSSLFSGLPPGMVPTLYMPATPLTLPPRNASTGTSTYESSNGYVYEAVGKYANSTVDFGVVDASVKEQIMKAITPSAAPVPTVDAATQPPLSIKVRFPTTSTTSTTTTTTTITPRPSRTPIRSVPRPPTERAAVVIPFDDEDEDVEADADEYARTVVQYIPDANNMRINVSASASSAGFPRTSASVRGPVRPPTTTTTTTSAPQPVRAPPPPVAISTTTTTTTTRRPSIGVAPSTTTTAPGWRSHTAKKWGALTNSTNCPPDFSYELQMLREKEQGNYFDQEREEVESFLLNSRDPDGKELTELALAEAEPAPVRDFLSMVLNELPTSTASPQPATTASPTTSYLPERFTPSTTTKAPATSTELFAPSTEVPVFKQVAGKLDQINDLPWMPALGGGLKKRVMKTLDLLRVDGASNLLGGMSADNSTTTSSLVPPFLQAESDAMSRVNPLLAGSGFKNADCERQGLVSLWQEARWSVLDAALLDSYYTRTAKRAIKGVQATCATLGQVHGATLWERLSKMHSLWDREARECYLGSAQIALSLDRYIERVKSGMPCDIPDQLVDYKDIEMGSSCAFESYKRVISDLDIPGVSNTESQEIPSSEIDRLASAILLQCSYEEDAVSPDVSAFLLDALQTREAMLQDLQQSRINRNQRVALLSTFRPLTTRVDGYLRYCLKSGTCTPRRIMSQVFNATSSYRDCLEDFEWKTGMLDILEKTFFKITKLSHNVVLGDVVYKLGNKPIDGLSARASNRAQRLNLHTVPKPELQIRARPAYVMDVFDPFSSDAGVNGQGSDSLMATEIPEVTSVREEGEHILPRPKLDDSQVDSTQADTTTPYTFFADWHDAWGHPLSSF